MNVEIVKVKNGFIVGTEKGTYIAADYAAAERIVKKTLAQKEPAAVEVEEEAEDDL